MTINIIAVGKLKEEYLKAACNEYVKRLKAFCNINVIEIGEHKLPDNPSDKEILAGLLSESGDIFKHLNGNVYNIAMCIEGKQLSSVEFAEKISDVGINGKSTINIILGGSFGLHDNVKNAIDFKLSMSPMTFPHHLARVMILEQLYRAFMITGGGRYHK